LKTAAFSAQVVAIINFLNNEDLINSQATEKVVVRSLLFIFAASEAE
jgi:hypothetical protein